MVKNNSQTTISKFSKELTLFRKEMKNFYKEFTTFKGEVKTNINEVRTNISELRINIKDIVKVLSQHTASLLTIENTLKFYGDMYQMNKNRIENVDNRVKKLEKLSI